MPQIGPHYLRYSTRPSKRNDEEDQLLRLLWIIMVDIKWRMRRLIGAPSNRPSGVALDWLAWKHPVMKRVGDNQYPLVSWRKQ